MTKTSDLERLVASIRSGEVLAPLKMLVVEKRLLRLEGFAIGTGLSDSSWAFLDLLVELRPRCFDRGSTFDEVLALDHKIGNSIRADNARREFQRQLPCKVPAGLFVQTLHGKGYRLRADVRLPGRSEAGLQYWGRPEDYERPKEPDIRESQMDADDKA